MTVLADILSMLRNPEATSQALRDQLAKVDVGNAERVVEALEADRRALLLREGTDRQILAIDEKIRAANLEVERLVAAKVELERKIKIAEEHEHQAALEAAHQRAATARSKLIGLYPVIDDQAFRLSETLDQFDGATEELKEANRFLANNGQSDRKVLHPMYDLAKICGLSTPEALPRPHEWQLSGIRPLHPRGHVLARAKELK